VLCVTLLAACAAQRPEATGALSGPSAGPILEAEDRRDPAPARALVADSSPQVRARAALALGRIGDAADVDALAALVSDPSADVRATAAFALGLVGQASASRALAGLLEDPEPEVRARAGEALIRIQATDAASMLQPILEGDDPAAEALLLRIWRLQDANVLDPVLAAAEGEQAGRRAAAAYSLMRMVGPPNTGGTPVPGGADLSAVQRDRAAAALVMLATDESPRVRELAARGLGGGNLPGAEAALVSLLADPSWQVRANALRALSRIGDGFDPELLLPASTDDHVNVRLAAVQSLGTLPSTAEMAHQVEALREAPELPVRLAAHQALATWMRAEYLPTALQLAVEDDPVVRAAAAGMLAVIPGAAATSGLQSLLQDPSPLVGSAALNALAGRDGVDPAALGAESLQKAPDVTVRAAAVGLLPVGDPSILPILETAWRRAFNDPLTDVRMVVTRTLQGIPGDEAAGLLRRVLAEDPDWRVRVEAAAVLRARGDDPDAGAGPLDTGRSPADYERLAQAPKRLPQVELVLGRGRILLELFAEDAPLTVDNFTTLAESGYFNGVTFHRVIPNFVIQGGDPRGDGWGGPGYQIRCEINQRPYQRGILGMALDGKDTGGSQFFITHTPQPHLDGGYTVFGRVLEGMDVVDQVVQGEVITEARVIR
jgi:cyclophilin family peptidyl-prolyl cis-trans isomerase/HEAT repeat protein